MYGAVAALCAGTHCNWKDQWKGDIWDKPEQFGGMTRYCEELRRGWQQVRVICWSFSCYTHSRAASALPAAEKCHCRYPYTHIHTQRLFGFNQVLWWPCELNALKLEKTQPNTSLVCSGWGSSLCTVELSIVKLVNVFLILLVFCFVPASFKSAHT